MNIARKLFLHLTLVISLSVNLFSQNGIKSFAEDVKNETSRAWEAYSKYAWGHDELLPLTKASSDWYDEPLYISPIDAYSTLKIMGFDKQAERIEKFVCDSLSFDKDIYVKTFEVNIRILGGLLSMYDFTGNEKVLKKAEEFAERILPAFDTPSGMPYYYVNLKTGKVKGDTICAAEAGSYLIEMGVLSYYTNNPKYYQAAKKSTECVYHNRSAIGLIGRDYDVTTGLTIDRQSRVGCYVDSYYEYLYKAWLLFGDNDLKEMWDNSIKSVNKYIAVETDSTLWYGISDTQTGEISSSRVTLYDAYFPALLYYSGNKDKAIKSLKTWNKLWSKNGLIPGGYDFASDKITSPGYYLNPELIESTYYIWFFTKDPQYLEMIKEYYSDIKKYCRTDIAYTHIKNVVDKEQLDELATFFFAETMKYFYLSFTTESEYNLNNYVFTTEAHPFKISNFDKQIAKTRLGF